MTSCADGVGIAVIDREKGVIADGQRCRQPRSRCVAGCARGRPSRCNVVRVRRSSKVGFMAGIAVRRSSCEDVIYVAEIACNCRVCSGEWKWRVVVIECCAGPRRRRVASFARGWEPGGCVVGICGAFEVRLMAAIAVRR